MLRPLSVCAYTTWTALTAHSRIQSKTASQSPQCTSGAPVVLWGMCVCRWVGGWMDGRMNEREAPMCDRIKATAPPPCQSTTNARTELAEVLDRLDVGAEEALHLRVHDLDRHLVLFCCPIKVG